MDAQKSRKIYGMAKQLGLNNDELHCLVQGVTGCSSLKELDDKQIGSVISELASRLRGISAAPRVTKKPCGKAITAPGMMTNAQKGKAWALMYELIELDGAQPAEAYSRMHGAIKKILGINMGSEKDPFRSIDFDGGSKLIETLKLYVKSAERKAIKKGAARAL